MVLVFH